MFGIPTLYDTVIGEYDAARRRVAAREAKEEARATQVVAPTRPMPLRRRVGRAVVPAALRARLRPLLGRPAQRSRPIGPPPPPAAAPDLEVFRTFSTEDLFYSDRDLDRALDLIAVCRRTAD
jgi:hypothetical protein